MRLRDWIFTLAIIVVLMAVVALSEDIGLEWDPYPDPSSITHFDAECTQDIMADPTTWTTMNLTPIPSTETNFVVQVSTGGYWFCRVNAVSVSGDSNTMKGIWKFLEVVSPGGARTP